MEKLINANADLFAGIKGAIFDLDGTLFDSLWVWEEVDRRFLSKRGFSVPSDYSQTISTMSFRQTAEYTIKRFKLDETPERLMSEWTNMSRELYAHEIFLKPFAKEFLEKLKIKGIKLGVATSSNAELYVPALRNNGILEFFDSVADTTGRRGKDFPDVYLAVAKELGIAPSEGIVFEDLPVALECVHREGFRTVAVFDKHCLSAPEFCDRFIRDFGELLSL